MAFKVGITSGHHLWHLVGTRKGAKTGLNIGLQKFPSNVKKNFAAPQKIGGNLYDNYRTWEELAQLKTR